MAAATTTIYNRDQEEEEAKAQRRRSRKERGQTYQQPYQDTAHLGGPGLLLQAKPCVWLPRSLATGRRNVPIEKNSPRHCPKCRAKGPLGSYLPPGQRTQRPGTAPLMALD